MNLVLQDDPKPQLVYDYFNGFFKLDHLTESVETAPKLFKPVKQFLWYDIDKKAVIATNWQIFHGMYMIRTTYNKVTDLYRKSRTNGRMYVTTYNEDITGKAEKYFRPDDVTQLKLHRHDDSVLQVNGTVGAYGYRGLPMFYKERLVDFPYKNLICGYGIKPYGNIISIWASEEIKRDYEACWWDMSLDNLRYCYTYNKPPIFN